MGEASGEAGCGNAKIGNVFRHANDPTSGTGVDFANVTWTSPTSGADHLVESDSRDTCPQAVLGDGFQITPEHAGFTRANPSERGPFGPSLIRTRKDSTRYGLSVAEGAIRCAPVHADGARCAVLWVSACAVETASTVTGEGRSVRR